MTTESGKMGRKKNNERTNRVLDIQNLPARYIKLVEPIDKKTAEGIARKFSTMTNINDGRKTLLPIGTVGKILRHSGFNLSRIIKDIPELYETSLLGWSESEILKDGHKAHSNIKEYRHYVNKFTDGNGEYYVRFTVSETKGYSSETRQNTIHSVAVSGIALYNKGDRSQHDRIIDPGEASPSPTDDSQRIRLEVPGGARSTSFVDRKLQEFFESA